MTSPNLQEYKEQDGALIVAEGMHGRVLLFGEAREEFETLLALKDLDSVAACVTIKRYFKWFAERGVKSLAKKMFPSEGRVKVGGEKVQVHAFKAKHVRIYGVADNLNGSFCFCGASCDPAKKKQKADAAKIKKAAEEWIRIRDEQKGS